jgi:hypothetical protein
MTQTVAASFDEFKRELYNFNLFLEAIKKGEFKREIIAEAIKPLLIAIKEQMEFYKDIDFKVRFFEWIQRDLAESVRCKKNINAAQKNYLLDLLRDALKDEFETILVAYPFVTKDIKFIKWNWTFRQILMVLYSLKEFGAFQVDTAETEISHLKDLIFLSGYNFDGRTDLKNSFDDTKTAWNRIMGRNDIDPVMSGSEIFAYEELKVFSGKLQDAINQYERND